MAKQSEQKKDNPLMDLVQEHLLRMSSRTKTLICVDLPTKNDRGIIVPIGDIHYGSPECNREAFEANLEWAYQNPEVYVLGMGDWLEAATRYSVGAGVYEQTVPIQNQLEEIVARFEPFAKDGRLIAVTNGNHEDRVSKAVGLDVTKVMAEMLGVPYYKNGGFFKVKVGPHNYHFYMTHGSSCATLPHTKIKRCRDLSGFVRADLYGMGHVHDLQAHTQTYMYIDNRSATVKEGEAFFLLTGHYLNWNDGYAQMKSMAPSKQGSPKIKLREDEKRIRVSL